jgi:hypothetical protein
MRGREARWVHRLGRADRDVHQPVTKAVTNLALGIRRCEGAGDGGRSAGDPARAPLSGRQVGPARGIVYGARREIGRWQRAMGAGAVQ